MPKAKTTTQYRVKFSTPDGLDDGIFDSLTWASMFRHEVGTARGERGQLFKVTRDSKGKETEVEL